MKKITLFFIFLCLLSSFTVTAYAENDASKYYYEQYENSGADSLKDFLPDETKNYLSDADLLDIDFHKLFNKSPKALAELMLDIASGEIKAPLKGMFFIMAVIVAVSLVKTFMPDEKLSGAINIAETCTVILAVIFPVCDVIKRGITAICAGSDFMLALIPVMAGIVTMSGNPALALSYNTLSFFCAQAVSKTAKGFIVPMSGIYTASGLISSLSPELNLGGVTDLIKKTAMTVFTFSAAVFSAVLTLKGVMAGAADNLLSRGIKLAVSTSVPLVGGALSEAYSSIIGSLALLKSAVGMFSIIAVTVINLPVILEILFWIFAFKLSSAAAMVLGSKSSSDILNLISSALSIINSAVLFECVLFIISSAIVLSLRTAV